MNMIKVCASAFPSAYFLKRPVQPLPSISEEDSDHEGVGQGALRSCRDHQQPTDCHGDALGDPTALAESSEKTREFIQQFKTCSKLERRNILAWMLPAIHLVALSQQGCRLVQEILAVVTGPDQKKLLQALEPYVEELYLSAHGNHVLSKVIEVMPSSTLGPVISKLQGYAVTVARHRFGCRVLERLIEHCSESQLSTLMREIIVEARSLSRHPFGNFVVQHLIQYGSVEQRSDMLAHLLPVMPALSMHRCGSHVVERWLEYGDEEIRAAIIAVLVASESPNSLPEIAGNRYGSFVIDLISEVPEVQHCLRERRDVLPEGNKDPNASE